MSTYTYRGTLSDFSEVPFPGASPKLWVSPARGAFTAGGGVLASREIEIPVKANGSFSVALVASADLRPERDYTLRSEWLDAEGIVRGWAEWDFTAGIGGGDIADMPNTGVRRVWLATYPPPVSRGGVYWVNPATGDVKEWFPG